MERDPNTRVDLQVALELAEREGVPAVIAGSVTPLSGGYVLAARLVSVADTTELEAVRETAGGDYESLQAAIDRLSIALRRRIGEPLRSLRGSEPIARVTTQYPEAFRKYAQAIRTWVEGGDYRPALSLLREAVAIDTTFASAYQVLAVIYRQNAGLWSEWREALTNAYRYRSKLPDEYRLYIEAQYYAEVERDLDKTVAVYESVLERDPDDAGALMNLSHWLLETRQWTEVEHYALRAIEQDRENPFAWWNLVESLAGQGRFAEAESTVTELAQLFPDNLLAPSLQAMLITAQRRFEEAGPVLDSLRSAAPGEALVQRAIVAIARGRFAEGERYYGEFASMPTLPLRRLVRFIILARTMLWAGDAAGALTMAEQARRRYPLDSLAPDNRASPYLWLALFYADAGMTDQAKEYLDAFRSEVHPLVQRQRPMMLLHRAEGAVALAEGRYRDAITSYRRFYSGSKCAVCGLYGLGRAYELAGEADSAVAVYERALHTPGLNRAAEERLTLPPTYERLAALYAERGDRDNAIEFYNRFIELWEDADPELQPRVEEARARLASFGEEPRPPM
jgi:tetratricopeptide (TPR) repeat protein